MTRIALAASAILLSAALAQAESYTAVGNTATSVTGDIAMDDYAIIFANGEKLVFSDLVAYELTVGGKKIEADVYKVAAPGDPVLLNGNRLCGSGDVTYVASWLGADDLTVIAVFATAEVPASDDRMCASYTYK